MTVSVDILASWKVNRFIVNPSEDAGELIIILTDIDFWNSHYEELKDWCDQNGCSIEGMSVVAENNHALTAFCLKWT
jgi:hypothetical protein